MKHAKLSFGRGFRVVFGNDRAQVAEMVLAPGTSEGDRTNRHIRADQWLHVVNGTGMAVVNGKPTPLRAGVLLLIERRDRHEIRNTGRTLLRTLNYYVPPAYTKAGSELPAARRN
jgi:mannose-6-phosphate isomerase-like protein (cupin superfamily)